ncbi:hypothetical protein PRIPAC_89040 [Pristionchus pacificus]|uniref:Uncharacterized protein n=1 Tax=Pristionchus pacificus TaxID=54126 RepID=A0A2A6B787_PRIPA|nr:hypothetical protein PRIPAC_89040 [Pristionchus pacificus]|eukprot:PDM61736.1 hypothetical protein PRIPAC_51178 [Pristionchus pacificus]
MDKKHKQPPQGQQPMYPNIPGLPPGMMPPNTGGKPMVVVVMKGGGQPNMGGLPFMMGGAPPPQQGGKKKKKKGSKGGKKKKKSGEKSKTKKSGEEESDSDSDRVNAPDIPAAHTHKPPPGSTSPNPQSNGQGGNGGGNEGGGGHGGGGAKKGGHNANPMASSFGSTTTDGGAAPSSSTTSTTSQAGAAGAAGAAGGGGAAAGAAAGAVKKTPAKKPAVKKAPAKPGIKKEAFIIKDGNVDKSCVPAFVLVDGPAGCPVIVPIDARDENAIVNELGPQPLTVAPKETTRGYLVLNEEGLLHFKPEKECKGAPFASTPGQLQKFLINSNIFIADVGPQLPDEKAYNKASTATKDKIGGKDLPVSGHVTMVTDKGTCKFSRVVITQTFPFYPPNAAFGVLVRDFTNGYVYFVPTENRFVGMVLSQGIKQPFKPVVEASIVGNIYKDGNGAAVWGVPSDKQDNIMGFIMCSGTGVPIYVPKPDDVQRPATPVKKAPVKGAVTPGAVSVTGQTASPSPASAAASTTNATGAVAGADGTASTTVPLAGAQGGETGGAAKPVDSVTCTNAQQGGGGGGVTSMTVPIAATTDPAAAAAAGGEDMKDQLKKMVAAQQELPPPEPEPPAAAEAKEEEKKEEEEAPPPPPPPKKPSQSQTNIEYKAKVPGRSFVLLMRWITRMESNA